MRTLAALLSLFAALLTASAAQADPDPFATGHEVGTEPGLYESYDEAAAYWAQVPGVPKIEDACGPPPIIYSVNTGTANAWGKAKDGDPCKIWVEDQYMAATDAMVPIYWRDLDRCLAIVHEYGHVLGLEHGDHGDPNKVMAPGATVPEVCLKAYLPPATALLSPSAPVFDPVPPKVICLPSWAFYGPPRAHTLYVDGKVAEARKLFKRWSKRHRREARRISAKAAVCMEEGVA